MVAALLVGPAAATNLAASWPSGPMENQLDGGCSTWGFYLFLIFTFQKHSLKGKIQILSIIGHECQTNMLKGDDLLIQVDRS